MSFRTSDITPSRWNGPLRARTIVLLLILLAVGQAFWAAQAGAGHRSALSNVSTTPSGTDKHGRSVTVRTTTDADGRYRFTGSSQDAQDAGVLDLVNGHSTVTISTTGLPTGTRFTTQDASDTTDALDSDADPRTGRASVTLPQPGRGLSVRVIRNRTPGRARPGVTG